MDKNSLAHTRWECKYHEAVPIANSRVKQVIMPSELLGLGATTMDYKGYDS